MSRDPYSVLPQRVKDLAHEASVTLEYHVPVLVSGGAASEREALARWIHTERKDRGEFVAIRCSREDGAGLEAALSNGKEPGTYYLDEIDALDPKMQEQVSRFLERKGSHHVIASTAADALALVEGGFSKVLFYRLNAIHLAIGDPPVEP